MHENLIGMQSTSTSAASSRRFLPLFALLLGAVALFGLLIAWSIFLPDSGSLGGEKITAETLTEEYGIQVDLIAVTAAGGLVDLRLKILDIEKARLLLQDSTDMPVLLVGDGNTMLSASQEGATQLIKSLTDDSPIFLIFPNQGNIVEPGTLVTVQIGDVRLEPLPAQ